MEVRSKAISIVINKHEQQHNDAIPSNRWLINTQDRGPSLDGLANSQVFQLEFWNRFSRRTYLIAATVSAIHRSLNLIPPP